MDDMMLKALLAADMPPAQDLHFVMAVMLRAEQRRFRRELAKTAGLAIAAALLLALIAPSLGPALSGSFAPMLDNGVLATALLVLIIVVPRLFAGRND
jgi:hypothetical protein